MSHYTKAGGKSRVRRHKTDGNQNVKEILENECIIYTVVVALKELHFLHELIVVREQQRGRIYLWVLQNQNFLLFTAWLWFEMCPCGNGPVVLFDFLPSRCLKICKSSQAFSVSSALVAKVLQGKNGLLSALPRFC